MAAFAGIGGYLTFVVDEDEQQCQRNGEVTKRGGTRALEEKEAGQQTMG